MSVQYHTSITRDEDGRPTDYKLRATDRATGETAGSLTACPVMGTLSVEVIEKLRRKGIGSQLMRNLEFLVRHESGSPMSLAFCCDQGNTAALAMFEKLGYMLRRPGHEDVHFVYCGKVLRAPSPREEMTKLQARGYTFLHDPAFSPSVDKALASSCVVFMMPRTERKQSHENEPPAVLVSGHESMAAVSEVLEAVSLGSLWYTATFRNKKKVANAFPHLKPLPLSARDAGW